MAYHVPVIFQRLQNAINYAERNLSGRIDFKTAAAEAYMSVATFYRTFETFVGMSFMEYVRKRRLTAALAMLKKRTEITRNAFDLGYADSNSFSQAFRREYGMSPSGYARSGVGFTGQPRVDLLPEVLNYHESTSVIERRNIMNNIFRWSTAGESRIGRSGGLVNRLPLEFHRE